ncbi:unnamed protein product [Ceratitis capitata]|uniref:(Mediterranean fruit fly) hypothetical protein n=1 Tax=Ceratitis capitata TaxID=7213 RepID=A0A811V595_CERCA|nr:unnamed protein product [Ceratitis capitata]
MKNLHKNKRATTNLAEKRGTAAATKRFAGYTHPLTNWQQQQHSTTTDLPLLLIGGVVEQLTPLMKNRKMLPCTQELYPKRQDTRNAALVRQYRDDRTETEELSKHRVR